MDDEQWTEIPTLTRLRYVEELRDLAFAYVADACEHELLALDKTYEVNVCLSNDAEVQRLNEGIPGKGQADERLVFCLY